MSREQFIFVLNNMSAEKMSIRHMSAEEFILVLANSVFIMAGTIIVAMLICLFLYGVYSVCNGIFKKYIKLK